MKTLLAPRWWVEQKHFPPMEEHFLLKNWEDFQRLTDLSAHEHPQKTERVLAVFQRLPVVWPPCWAAKPRDFGPLVSPPGESQLQHPEGLYILATADFVPQKSSPLLEPDRQMDPPWENYLPPPPQR